jgi:hypothetical protein
VLIGRTGMTNCGEFLASAAMRCQDGAVRTALSGRGTLPANFEVVEEVLGGGGDGGDCVLERLRIVPGRRAESADLPDVLERSGTDVSVGDLLGVGLAECLDAAAHASDVTLRPIRCDA